MTGRPLAELQQQLDETRWCESCQTHRTRGSGPCPVCVDKARKDREAAIAQIGKRLHAAATALAASAREASLGVARALAALERLEARQ